MGTTLADIIQALKARGWPAPIPAIFTLFTEALYGLDHAHRLKDRSGAPHNLIHRDLTPSNLLVSWDGQVKIVDFGIARATHLRHHTVGTLVKGKLRYLSPEQRFESAAALRDALEEYQFQAKVRASPAALARMMQDLFQGRIDAEQQQISRETRAADDAQPLASPVVDGLSGTRFPGARRGPASGPGDRFRRAGANSES